jgi:hypothetical protein
MVPIHRWWRTRCGSRVAMPDRRSRQPRRRARRTPRVGASSAVSHLGFSKETFMSTLVTPRDFAWSLGRTRIWVDPPDTWRYPGQRGGPSCTPRGPWPIRMCFTLGVVPERVRGITGIPYILFVKRQEVSRGPVRSQPWRLHLTAGPAPTEPGREHHRRAGQVLWQCLLLLDARCVEQEPLHGALGRMVFEAGPGRGRWLVTDGSGRRLERRLAVPPEVHQRDGESRGNLDARRLPAGGRNPALMTRLG